MAECAQDVRRMALGVLQSRLLDLRQLQDEFQLVLSRDSSIRHSFVAAQAAANTSKNRYVNVLPYDHNRVRLQPCTIPAALAPQPVPASSPCPSFLTRTAAAERTPPPPNSADYINASHIFHDDMQYGFSLSFIACQGPLSSTVSDFWRMCWVERVGAVVMLTNTFERGVTKCSPYYPHQPGARLVLQQSPPPAVATGPVCCLSEVVAVSGCALHEGDLTHTKIQLRTETQQQQQQLPAGTGAAAVGSCRELTHLHYNAWPDHGTPPSAAAIRTMCDLLEPVRAAGGAVVVHCSAGIGRTGTFCAIDILRRRLAALAAAADTEPGSVRQEVVHAAMNLPDIVHGLRRQRGGMVQTFEQYVFCYQAILEELLETERRPLEARCSGGGGHMGTPPRLGRY